MCALYHITTNEPIILSVGEKGYSPAPHLDTPQKVKAFNEAYGADSACISAMELGSIAGFHVPGANPELWRTKWKRGAEKYDSIAAEGK